jgi:hypothetical protein
MIYYKDGAKMMRPVLTREEYLSLRNGGEQRQLVTAIRSGNKGLKHKLLQMNYSCLPNVDGTLKGSKRMSTTVGMDVDHLTAEEMPKVKERILQKKDELGLGMLEESARGGGYHLVFRRRPELSQEENLRWASDLLGVEFDKGAKDITRVFFTTTKAELLYLSDEIFETSEAVLTNTNRTNETNKKYSNSQILDKEKDSSDSIDSCSDKKEASGEASPSFKGIPYASIIAEWLRRTGGEPQLGERNDRLHRLAAHLRYITDNKEATLLEVMPRYGLAEDEMRALIHSACSSRFYSMPRLMKEIVDELSPAKSTDDAVAVTTGVPGATPPPMPKRLPPLIRLLLSRTPDIYRPAVAQAVFPSLGAHLYQTRFRYIDNVEHEATLMNVLMANTGAGKDCISSPINHIMADIRRRDAENLAREKAWKDEVNRKGANKDKRQRPEGLVIQEIDADMTGPAFVMRMAEADGHFLYTKMNEIDQFDALKGNGHSGQQFQIMCLAFDPDNRYGQTRVGTQSVTEKVCIRFNWNASTTVQKGRRYFERVLTDGPISRINFCTIPEREIGAEMPVYGTYDARFDEELRPYIERLTSARGTIECPEAFRLVTKLKNECADFARLSQSRTYENLSFRALVIAYLKACVLYVAHDYRWDKTMEDFTRWSLQYDLWCKMHFFGEAIEKAGNAVSSSDHRGPRNLLELLPDEFTLDDAVRVRREQGLPSRGTQDMIRMWRNRGYIEERTNEQLNSFVFGKLKYRH